ncbi:hypothetical protein E7740_11125 (plasmid) [Micrococcus luteus]
MTEPLLTALRERVIDESEPLAGLLRKCLLLGAETGSKSLREWARSELNGYADDVEVPAYRVIHAGMVISYVSGYNRVRGQPWSWYNLPAKAREIVPEQLSLRSPLAELEQMATRQSVHFGSGRLSMAMQILNSTLPVGQDVDELAYAVQGAALAGVVDRIRTNLVEFIADLTADTPLDQLPSTAAVDAAVKEHLGVQYTTHVYTPAGPVAVGEGAQAHAQGSLEELVKALADLREQAEGEGEGELVEAVEELREAVQAETPDGAQVEEKAGRLSRVAEGLGNTAMTTAVSGVVEGATSLLMSGLFG